MSLFSPDRFIAWQRLKVLLRRRLCCQFPNLKTSSVHDADVVNA
jgi:hypothetical protein